MGLRRRSHLGLISQETAGPWGSSCRAALRHVCLLWFSGYDRLMTSWETPAPARIPAEEIAARAREIRFTAVAAMALAALATAVAAVFVALGWTIGRSWYALVFCAVAVRYGFRQGAMLPVPGQKPPPGAVS